MPVILSFKNRRLQRKWANEHETLYRQPGNDVGNCEGSPILSKNYMNFGPQTAKNTTFIFTHRWRYCNFKANVCNEIWHRQPETCIANYQGSHRHYQNLINFGWQPAKNRTFFLMHHPVNAAFQSTSLSAFANGGHQTRINQTVPNARGISIKSH